MKDRDFISLLLKGAVIMKRPCRRKGYNHAIYNANMVVVANVSDGMMRSYNHMFKQKKGRMTFNLNLVRQEHGNSLVKVLYKQHKKSMQHDNA